MSKPTNKRRRAVRLTQEAINLLSSRLMAQWESLDTGTKLTRTKRAELMGVSAPTADRILSGQGVDRSSILEAFKCADLEWSESFCVSLDLELPTEPSPESSTRLLPHPVPQRRSWKTTAYATFVTLFLLSVPFWEYFYHFGIVNRQLAGITEFSNNLTAATSALDSGNYALAASSTRLVKRAAEDLQSASRIAVALRLEGDIATAQGDLAAAKSAYEEALHLRRLIKDDKSQPPIQESLGVVEMHLGHFEASERTLKAARSGFMDSGDLNGVASVERYLGYLHLEKGVPRSARKTFESAKKHCPPRHKELLIDIQAGLAMVQLALGHPAEARTALEKCLAFWKSKNHPRWIARTEVQLAKVSISMNDLEGALMRLNRSRTAYMRLGDKLGVRNCDRLIAQVTPSKR